MTENKKGGLFARLAKTRNAMAKGLTAVLGGGVNIDEEVFDDIEDQLVMADLGVEASRALVESLRTQSKQQKIGSPEALLQALRNQLAGVLNAGPENDEKKSADETEDVRPFVILMVGVNGVGKTTTVAKLANHYQKQGKSVMLAAADTFRAAAIEQLQRWGERLGLTVVAQQHGADAAAVAHDAITSAQARNVDVLIVDTAGRQHTHGDLMDQLRKIERVLGKVMPDAPHEVFITVDAGNGQNVLSQVQSFSEAVRLTGVCVTKLDGTAKGGVVIALTQKFKLPVRFIGVGEGVEDFQEFSTQRFCEALLPDSLDAE